MLFLANVLSQELLLQDISMPRDEQNRRDLHDRADKSGYWILARADHREHAQNARKRHEREYDLQNRAAFLDVEGHPDAEPEHTCKPNTIDTDLGVEIRVDLRGVYKERRTEERREQAGQQGDDIGPYQNDLKQACHVLSFRAGWVGERSSVSCAHPDPKAQQDCGGREDGHDGAGEEVHEATQIHEDEVSDIGQAANETCNEGGEEALAPDEDSGEERCQADPKQVEPVLIDHRIRRGMIGGLKDSRVDRVGNPCNRFRGGPRDGHDAGEHVYQTPDDPKAGCDFQCESVCLCHFGILQSNSGWDRSGLAKQFAVFRKEQILPFHHASDPIAAGEGHQEGAATLWA